MKFIIAFINNHFCILFFNQIYEIDKMFRLVMQVWASWFSQVSLMMKCPLVSISSIRLYLIQPFSFRLSSTKTFKLSRILDTCSALNFINAITSKFFIKKKNILHKDTNYLGISIFSKICLMISSVVSPSISLSGETIIRWRSTA